MARRPGLQLLAPGLLGFWGCYFGIVAASNLADLLRALHLLPEEWPWVSGNLAFVAASTARAGVPAWMTVWLLAGVIAWQGVAAALFWRAVRRGPADDHLGPPFAWSIGLWAAFILLDEVLLIFETGAEATHVRLLVAQLASLLVIRGVR